MTTPHSVHPPQVESNLVKASLLPSFYANNAGQRQVRVCSSDEASMVNDVDELAHPHSSDSREAKPKDGQSRERLRSPSPPSVTSDDGSGDTLRSHATISRNREQSNQLDDDLTLLNVEKRVSKHGEDSLPRTKGQGGATHCSNTRSRGEHIDEFDFDTSPIHEQTQLYKPMEHPTTKVGRFLKQIHHSNWLIRWFTYTLPVFLILLIPLLLGAFVFKDLVVGGVHLMWFMIWLEIVWLTLWVVRVLAKCLPWPIGMLSSVFTNNSKKWRDMGKQLEIPATLFFWCLAIKISFLPTMKSHQRDHGYDHTASWMNSTNKVLISLLVGAVLNFVEKIAIQLIAITFHLRTYADRIEINKFQIGSLVKLYAFSKEKIAMDDDEFEEHESPGSGARTQAGQALNDAKQAAKQGLSKFGDVAGKVAGDFTGKNIVQSSHPSQVVLALLSSTSGAQVLARRMYRTFAREDIETVVSNDLRPAFDNEEEATAAFTMFDKDMNGDISMEELESVCVEIGRERKSIIASLKDLDSVVSKLNDVLVFVVCIIVVLVFISLISSAAAGVLTSAGSAVLALSWLFSATAQEFLQSIIFVFVKHPFDVGDRVRVYGNTGDLLRGDDFFVKEISLLYTEFKKMEGHIVQAPNSYLNTLFILNQRRSGCLAEAVSITIKFGTTLEQIDGLRTKLLEFVNSEKREYQGNILTELREIVEVHSMKLNVVFFYKSNWQNEGLRLARRNKFICALMVTMQELGIEGPHMRLPGMRESFPMYTSTVPYPGPAGAGNGGHPGNPYGTPPESYQDPHFVPPERVEGDAVGTAPAPSRMDSAPILKSGNGHGGPQGGESLARMSKRVDFSLGMKSYAALGELSGDVYEDRRIGKPPIEMLEASRERDRSAGVRISQERAGRGSQDTARSIRSRKSVSGDASRATDATSLTRNNSMYPNRFFGRSSYADTDNDMERGMSVAMNNIPEDTRIGNGANTPDASIEPRPGMVQSAAWTTERGEIDAYFPANGNAPPLSLRDLDSQGTSSENLHPEGTNVGNAPGGL